MPPTPPESPQSDTGLRCPKCGYNLTSLTSSTCPECGERFILTNARGYLAKFPPSKLRHAWTAIWLIGTLLIILSWFNVVPNPVGWIGFAISGVGWVASLSLKQ